MKKIYFVRHGESQANADGLASGSELDTPLTAKGRDQAKKTAQMLKDKKIDLIVCSSLGRAVETANIIAKKIGYDPNKIIKSEYFIERHFGIYSERPDEEYLTAALNDTMHESVEPAQEMHKRIVNGLEWLKSLDGRRILVVGHGGVSRILRLIHQDLPLNHMYRLDKLDNAAIYEFSL